MQTGDGIWTSGNVVINQIRNMFLYDLCNQINPKMKNETTQRFAGTWLNLLKIRKQINSAELETFSVEAKEKNMVNSYNWIHYQELSLFDKQVLFVKTISKCWRLIVRGVLEKLYHAI